MEDVPYYFIERISDAAWLTGSFQWTHDPNEAWKTTEKVVLENIVDRMFRNRCVVTEHLFIDEIKKQNTPIAYEWHNLTTGHCYVDYIPHQDMGEENGYIKIPLFKL